VVVLSATAAALGVAAGAGTSFVSTWRNPEAQADTFRGKKIVAVFVSPDEGERRSVEGLLASELTQRGAEGVPAVVLLPAPEIRDEAKVKARLAAAGVAGAVVFRLVAEDRQMTASPDAYYSGKTYASLWGGYWGVGWDGVYAPGMLLTQYAVHVEVLVYSLEQNKLLWAGQSSTSNPKRADKLVRDVVTKAAKEMKKAGLIQEGG
jgi:hypothetical protein